MRLRDKKRKFEGQKRALLILVLIFFSSCGKKGADYSTPNSEGQKYLIEAVKSYGALSVNGTLEGFICDLSESHLTYMIDQEDISHDNFSDRSEAMQNRGFNKTGEIVASNCGKSSLLEAAKQCAASWRKSANHWSSMKSEWASYCYALRQSGNCTYCIGLFANR